MIMVPKLFHVWCITLLVVVSSERNASLSTNFAGQTHYLSNSERHLSSRQHYLTTHIIASAVRYGRACACGKSSLQRVSGHFCHLALETRAVPAAWFAPSKKYHVNHLLNGIGSLIVLRELVRKKFKGNVRPWILNSDVILYGVALFFDHVPFKF